MDNLDGKQARKIKASSSLGMLFDHGLDSLATVLITLASTRIFMGNGFKTAFTFILVLFQFYMTTQEHYYLGVFNLPIINSVNEGYLLLILTILFTVIVGPHFWQKVVLGFMINTWILILLVFANVSITSFFM